MTTVLLVDLSSVVYPLFHMSGREPDQDWTSTQAVARVHALASNFDHVAVCVDGKRSFRKDIDPNYKANRPEKDSILIHQLRMTEEQLERDGFPLLKAETFEADDVIASAVNALYNPDEMTITIGTSDKDLMQLVCDGVCVKLVTNSGATLDADAVKVKYGVTPSQIVDYLSLMGDAADNVRGAKGIGEVKARELLTKWGSMHGVLTALHAGQTSNGFTPALAASLREFEARAEQVRQLITLRTDAPVDFTTIFQPRQRMDTANTEDSMSEPLETTPTIVDEAQPEAKPSAEVTKPSDALAVSTPVTDVEPFTGAWERQLEPRNPADARTIAKWLHASRLFAQYGSPEAVFSIVLAGRELGLGTMASLRGFHVVEGKPTMAADLIRALVLASGKAEYFVCKERTSDASTWETKRKGDPYPVELKFTWEDACKAEVKVKGSNGGATAWVKHRADMLAKTASAKLSRLVYSDVTFGLYATEELGGDE